jgi:hypothetical protein
VKSRIAEFLDIDPHCFGKVMPSPLYNQARQPRFKPLYKVARGLRDRHFRDFEWITAVERRFPILEQMLFQEPAPPPAWLLEEVRARRDIVNGETLRLGDVIGRDLSRWQVN